MLEADILLLVRGMLFKLALTVFVVGVIVRLCEILWLGRKFDYSEARGSALQGGLRTIISRNIPATSTLQRSALIVIVGYIFHLGFFLL